MHSEIQYNEKEKLILGSDAIAYLTPFQHPLIMVDRIIYYSSSPLSLIAERYISANEPAFVGHFPNMKLWPGIYTMEGLRQACYILQSLHELEEANMLQGILELNKRHILQPQINNERCQEVIEFLRTKESIDPDLFSIKIKFLEPVFAGTVIRFHCSNDYNSPNIWFVEASVNERIIAKGTIVQSFNVSS